MCECISELQVFNTKTSSKDKTKRNVKEGKRKEYAMCRVISLLCVTRVREQNGVYSMKPLTFIVVVSVDAKRLLVSVRHIRLMLSL